MEENTFHYIINPDHEEYPLESIIGKNASLIKKVEMYHSISDELLNKHTSTTHFTINLTCSYPYYKATDIADDRQQTARSIILSCWFPEMREQLCRLWFEPGWFTSIGDIKIRVIHETGLMPSKHNVHEVRLSFPSNGNTKKMAVYARDAARVHQRS